LHYFSPSPIEIFFVFSVDLALLEDGQRIGASTAVAAAEAGEMSASSLIPLLAAAKHCQFA
jgi:hypothetical protein